MSRLPASQQSFTKVDNNFLIDGQRTVQGEDVVIASGQTTSFSAYSTRPHWIPEGTVVVKRTSDSKYFLADDVANGDRNTAASITSVAHADGNGVIAVNYRGQVISVVTATGSGTEADNVLDLNADAEFAAHLIAVVDGTDIKISTKRKGEQERFFIDASTRDAAGFAEGVANEVVGTNADYRVTATLVSLKLIDASDADAISASLTAGKFKTSLLQNATEEAKQALRDNGSELL